MPTYVYKFIETGETIEVQQSFHDEPLTEAAHPTTGATMAVKKVFLPVGITFKGDGFYKTDSRAESKKSSSKSDKSGSSDTSGSSSDSKSSGNGDSSSSSGSSGADSSSKPAATTSSGSSSSSSGSSGSD